VNDRKLGPDTMEALQRQAFEYFVHEANPLNGLVVDKTRPGAPASIAATGLALSCYPIGAERGFITRAQAVRRTLATLRFFQKSVQSTDPDATGYKGFYYHFLDISGKRVRNAKVDGRYRYSTDCSALACRGNVGFHFGVLLPTYLAAGVL
jgi:hypothetical protein